MKAVSLKLPENLDEASRRCAGSLGLSRATYVRLAVEEFNQETQARARAKRLVEASRKVRGESMRVNDEFSSIEEDPHA